MKTSDFSEVLNQLEWIASSYGFQRGIISSQIILETGNGSVIRGNNLFNIKSTPKWLGKGGAEVCIDTLEYIGSKAKYIQSCFRKYSSYTESLLDYIEIIKNYYPKAWNFRHSYKEYFIEIQKGGYATDPDYAKKCINIFERKFL